MRLLLDWLGGFRVGVALGRRAPRLPVDDYRSRRPRRCAGLLRQRLGSDPRPRHQRQPRRLAAVPAPARGRAALAPRGIEAEQVLLRTITLPPLLTAAIQEKLQAEQQAQRMRFVLDRERQEAQARGGPGHRRLPGDRRVAHELPKSRNTKIVVLGDKSGLPIILSDK